MVAVRNTAGKVKKGTAAKKGAVKKQAGGKRALSKAERLVAGRKAIALMSVKIRRKSKELAASTDRLLKLVA